ncbi:tRNA (adenosine(37)-N6)-threonylcarbamoyltransferase complex ATPase subunit type 1 TsaE [Propioniciclava sp.]|uniref:tRNA (adenosine(37)-N6)-threonylcarbamoyltransferase complex ATPase subunit type 1 TsaE n=1 Tax=Propioniciclava sp. TaxID=2038686 RepID=UPI0039E61186
MMPATAALAAATLPDGRELIVRGAAHEDAPAILAIVHRAFTARPVVGDKPEALSDDLRSVEARLEYGHGYLTLLDGEPIAVVMVARQRGALRLGRVGVLPEYRQLGVASFVIGVVLEDLAARGEERVQLLARQEFPALQAWWEKHGFVAQGIVEGNCVVMARALPVAIEVPDADAMRALGARLAHLLRAGDLIIASGDLGAGKTTLTQGIGAGLDVDGPVISPTFVLARVHPTRTDGPALVHVDAYRLGGFAELDDLGLDDSMEGAVTLVEWGTGVAEALASDRLEIDIRRGIDPDDETRWVFLTPIGPRWNRVALAAVAKEET